MPRLEKFKDLLIRELKQLHFGEKLLLISLPKLAEEATDPALRRHLRAQAKQARGRMTRLEEALYSFKRTPRSVRCPTVKDLILAAREIAGGPGSPAVKDAGLILIAQKICHHGICGYGSARTLAQVLGFDEVAARLQESLEEEATADRGLTDIAVDLYTSDETSDLTEPCVAELAFRS